MHLLKVLFLHKAIIMSAAVALQYISIEDYLAAEEIALEKHEYYKGEVFAMAGASIKHNRVVRNAQTEIDSFLKNKSCEVFPSDVRIHIEANTLFTYPDLTIFCDPVKLFGKRTDTATNPTVIIEVLSPSTQDYDRGSKFLLYRNLESLQEYILISSTQMLVEKYTRQSGNEWHFAEYKNATDEFTIQAIGFAVTVGTLYRNVNMDEE